MVINLAALKHQLAFDSSSFSYSLTGVLVSKHQTALNPTSIQIQFTGFRNTFVKMPFEYFHLSFTVAHTLLEEAQKSSLIYIAEAYL